jgi:hypothetical protein
MSEKIIETIEKFCHNMNKLIRLLFLTTCVCLVLFISFYRRNSGDADIDGGIRRHLSSSNDLNTGENVRTINGTIPETSCQLG